MSESTSLEIDELHHDHPAVPVGIAVHRLGLLHQRGIDLHDLAGERREEIGDRLDRLHHAERLHPRDLGADLRELDEDDVAELLLGERRDADPRPVALDLGPLVLAGVLEIRRNLHRRAPSSRRPIRAHLLRWRPRPPAQRTASTPRVRPSGAASHLDPSRPPADFGHSRYDFFALDGLNGVRATRAGSARPRISTARSVPTDARSAGT